MFTYQKDIIINLYPNPNNKKPWLPSHHPACQVKLEDAGFDWKILGPDVQDLDYVAWQCDQDAYACSGQKCSAQSVLFVHDNWAAAGEEIDRRKGRGLEVVNIHACCREKCSAQSVLFVHDNLAAAGTPHGTGRWGLPKAGSAPCAWTLTLT